MPTDVKMAEPSSSKEQLDKVSRLANALGKGQGHEDVVARFQMEVQKLVAQAEEQTSGKVQCHEFCL